MLPGRGYSRRIATILKEVWDPLVEAMTYERITAEIVAPKEVVANPTNIDDHLPEIVIGGLVTAEIVAL